MNPEQAELARKYGTSRMTICKLFKIENQKKVLRKAKSLASRGIDLHGHVQASLTETEAHTQPSPSWDVSTAARSAEAAEPVASTAITSWAGRTASDPGPRLTTGIANVFDGLLLFRSPSEVGSVTSFSDEPESEISFSDEDMQDWAASADVDNDSEPIKQRVMHKPAGQVDPAYSAPLQRPFHLGSHDSHAAPAAQRRAQEKCPRHEEQHPGLAPALQFSLLSLFPAVASVPVEGTKSNHQMDHGNASTLDHRLTSDDKLAWLLELDAESAEHD